MRRQKIKYLSEEERRKLLSTLADRRSAERDYAIFDVFLNTGLRLSELEGLTVRDVVGRRYLEINGKGDKIREVPFNKGIRIHLQRFLDWKRKRGESLDPDAPLFVSRNGGRLTKRPIQRALNNWIKEAGITGRYSPHALRHTFGTMLYKRTGNIRLVQDLLGHSNISTTMIYTHVTKQEMANAVELLSEP